MLRIGGINMPTHETIVTNTLYGIGAIFYYTILITLLYLFIKNLVIYIKERKILRQVYDEYDE
jgi:hypothetical protein